MPAYQNQGPQQYAMYKQSRKDDWIRQLLQMFMMKQQQGREDKRWERTQGQREKYQQGTLDYYDALKEQMKTKQTAKPKKPELPTQAKMIEYMLENKIAPDRKTAFTMLNDKAKESGFTDYQQWSIGWKKKEDENEFFEDALSEIDTRLRVLGNTPEASEVNASALTNLNVLRDEMAKLNAKHKTPNIELTDDEWQYARSLYGKRGAIERRGIDILGNKITPKSESPASAVAPPSEPPSSKLPPFKPGGTVKESTVPEGTQVYEQEGKEYVIIDGKWKRLIKK
jgi:hypothetical protein